MASLSDTVSKKPVHIALLTLSDSRTRDNDTSGDILQQLAESDGHTVVARTLIKDDATIMIEQLNIWIADHNIDVIISTGGTGITGRDVTPEAVSQVIDVEIPGFGELFRMLSYQKIGASTIQSRAMAGRAKGTLIFAVPGSTGACKDAWQDILSHQLDNRTKPCNFVSLMPRFLE